jgi:hypothetical protein
LLNFGHTFGHAIEAGVGYGEWLHGEAVAAGMVIAAELSARRGELPSSDVERLRTLLQRLRLPIAGAALGTTRYLALMSRDKKIAAGSIRFVHGCAFPRCLPDSGCRAGGPADPAPTSSRAVAMKTAPWRRFCELQIVAQLMGIDRHVEERGVRESVNPTDCAPSAAPRRRKS